MATEKKTAKETKTKVKAKAKPKAKKKVGTKAISKAKVAEPTDVVAAEPEPEAPKEKPQKSGGNGSSKKPWINDGGWKSYELVAESVKRFKNPIGRDVTIKAEVRIPGGRNFLRAAVGRIVEDSPIGLSRQIFFEDLPFAIEALIDVYEQSQGKYVELETSRIRKSIERGLDSVESVISHNREDWSGKLLAVKKEMLNTLPDTSDV